MKLIFKKKFKIEELNNFRKISKDNNILHYKNRFSIHTPYKKPIVYAALLIKFILNKISKHDHSIREINAMFFKPVLVNEIIYFRINNLKNKANIVITNGIINKASINVDFENNDDFNKDDIFENLNLLSRSIGNFKKNLNIISFLNIKKILRCKKKITFKKKLDNNFFSLSFFKNFENSVNFVSYPVDKKNKRINNFVPKFGKKIELKKKDKNILIIGGSSGLGDILSKYFISQDLKHTLTFNNKKPKKIKLISKINFFKFNNKSSIKIFENLKKFDVIYFFATPEIFSFSNEPFDIKKYYNFNNIYINFFYKIVKILISSKIKHQIFVPSSVIINNPSDNIEYALSKKSTEYLLKIINNNCENLEIHNPRLDAYYTNNTKFFLNANKNYDNFIRTATKFI